MQEVKGIKENYMNRRKMSELIVAAREVADSAIAAVLNDEKSEENIALLYSLIKYNSVKAEEAEFPTHDNNSSLEEDDNLPF